MHHNDTNLSREGGSETHYIYLTFYTLVTCYVTQRRRQIWLYRCSNKIIFPQRFLSASIPTYLGKLGYIVTGYVDPLSPIPES